MTQRTYTQAVNTALHLAMGKDNRLVAFGLGINDPKRIFGTTSGLVEKFGPDRVFDTPTSENTMTGVQVGLALAGIPSIVTHQRLDFFLLAMDQLVNSAAKWHFMFGSQQSVPITIRLIIGKGWGQGPTHSQALHAWFSHIPGLKVIAPSNPRDAKEMTLAAIEDPNPVLILEHRWLHNSLGEFNDIATLKAYLPITMKITLKFCLVLNMFLTVRVTERVLELLLDRQIYPGWHQEVLMERGVIQALFRSI